MSADSSVNGHRLKQLAHRYPKGRGPSTPQGGGGGGGILGLCGQNVIKSLRNAECHGLQRKNENKLYLNECTN